MTSAMRRDSGGQVRQRVEFVELTRPHDREEPFDSALAFVAACAEHDFSPLHNDRFILPVSVNQAKFTTPGIRLSGSASPSSTRTHRRGELVAICEMPDGSRAVVPVWMLDRAACATLSAGPPRCSLAALHDLRSLLDALGFHGRAPSHVRDGQEDDHDRQDDPGPHSDPAVATVPVRRGNTSTGGDDADDGGRTPRPVADQRVHARRRSRGTR